MPAWCRNTPKRLGFRPPPPSPLLYCIPARAADEHGHRDPEPTLFPASKWHQPSQPPNNRHKPTTNQGQGCRYTPQGLSRCRGAPHHRLGNISALGACRASFFLSIDHSPPVPLFAPPPPPPQTIWRTFSRCLRIWPIRCPQFMMMARVVVGRGGSDILCYEVTCREGLRSSAVYLGDFPQ